MAAHIRNFKSIFNISGLQVIAWTTVRGSSLFFFFFNIPGIQYFESPNGYLSLVLLKHKFLILAFLVLLQ